MRTFNRVCAVTTLATLLSGCGAVLVGGVTTGAVVAHDRRTTGTVVEDKEIVLRAQDILRNHPDIKQRSNISISAYNLKVLLTGQAQYAEDVERFAALVAELPRVAHVFNEVTIGAEATWSDNATDAYLTSKVKLALFDVKIKGFDPLRVQVTTSKGTVYLMGLVTRAEAEAVTDTVRYVSGVEKVVRLFDYIVATD